MLPTDLVELIENRKVILFLGAGASAGSSIPSSEELVVTVLEDFLARDPGRIERLQEIFDFSLPGESTAHPMKEETKKACLRHFRLRDLAEVVVREEGSQAPLIKSLQPHRWCRSNPTAVHLLLGKLAGQGFLEEVFTTNYDDLIERGCGAVGTAVRAVRDGSEYTEREDGILQVYKIHGCLRRFQEEENKGDPMSVEQAARQIVITNRQLQNWRRDHWARELFKDRLRTHGMVFIGFSASDHVILETFLSVMEELQDGSRGRGAAYKHRTYIVTPEKKLTFPFYQMLEAVGIDDFDQKEKFIIPMPAAQFFQQLYRELQLRMMYSSFIQALDHAVPLLVWELEEKIDPGINMESLRERLKSYFLKRLYPLLEIVVFEEAENTGAGRDIYDYFCLHSGRVGFLHKTRILGEILLFISMLGIKSAALEITRGQEGFFKLVVDGIPVCFVETSLQLSRVPSGQRAIVMEGYSPPAFSGIEVFTFSQGLSAVLTGQMGNCDGK